MNTVKGCFEARVPAKVNLSLAVTGKRDALHTLDMIVCPYEKLADSATFSPAVSVSRAQRHRIELASAEATFDGFDIRLFQKFFLPKLDLIANELGISGSLRLKLEIPPRAGLGSSSAATVAAIKAAQACLEANGISHEPSTAFLTSLGSDVPCMYAGGICRVRGTGDIVIPLEGERVPNMIVRVPDCGSDSAACYALYDRMLQNGELSAGGEIPSSIKEAKQLLRNDLTLPATTLYPPIARLLAELKEDHERVMMTGSGSACFAFED